MITATVIILIMMTNRQ